MTKEFLSLIGQPEGQTVEYKSAKGGIPQSLWESYSSFANANGGVIVLGMKEKDGKAMPDQLTHDQVLTYKKRLWDNLHNKDVVNLCLLSDEDIEEVDYHGSWLLVIRVPRARFDMRPIYLTRNPFGNTFIRNHEGDYHCTDDEVRLMFADAESQNHSFDSKILKGFKLEHLDMPTIQGYRNRFNIHNTDHPWSKLSDMEFLTKIGAYRVDIEKGEEGFTRAGVLLFGKTESITDNSCAPYFFPDLQEWHILDRGERWSNRICPDGYWEANLFQFYYRAYSKLVQQLPVPFKLDGIQRVDETPAHRSIREALVNTLVHANYMLIGSIFIKIEPGRIIMRNPGRMLISVEEFYAGSRSKCRNPLLQNMFRFIGFGEKAGSGADIIAKGWEENHWARPTIKDSYFPSEETELILDLLKEGGQGTTQTTTQTTTENPQNVVDSVVDKLTERQRLILNIIRQFVVEHVVDGVVEEGVDIPSASSMAKQLKTSPRTLQRELAYLREIGKIHRIDGDKGGHWEIIE